MSERDNYDLGLRVAIFVAGFATSVGLSVLITGRPRLAKAEGPPEWCVEARERESDRPGASWGKLIEEQCMQGTREARFPIGTILIPAGLNAVVKFGPRFDGVRYPPLPGNTCFITEDNHRGPEFPARADGMCYAADEPR